MSVTLKLLGTYIGVDLLINYHSGFFDGHRMVVSCIFAPIDMRPLRLGAEPASSRYAAPRVVCLN